MDKGYFYRIYDVNSASGTGKIEVYEIKSFMPSNDVSEVKISLIAQRTFRTQKGIVQVLEDLSETIGEDLLERR